MDPRPQPRLLEWWQDDPTDPDRPLLTNPDVQRLIDRIAPGTRATDLGGLMSLNARLEPQGLVLRVHQPFVSRRRLLAVQDVRRRLADAGLLVPVPVRRGTSSVFRCGKRWAELEPYIPHERLEQAPSSYHWLFAAMGALHRRLAALDVAVPRPQVATFATPGSLRRWMPLTEAAVRGDPEAADGVRLLHDLVRRLRTQWTPTALLPGQLVHGDIRLANVGRLADGRPIYLDFGFLAHRPRIHDLGYSLAFMVLGLGGHQAPEAFAWHRIPELVAAYETAAGWCLTPAERRALAPYAAAVPLYGAALAGFSEDPVRMLRARLPFLRLSRWLLTHPDAMPG